ncbi:MAG TPA: HNH endonuclease [Thermoleophilia bacterium]|nr:HNH endonuclease [Thermoleophilia bacterium]
MKAYVAVTDKDWFEHLSRDSTVDEVNFWQPSPDVTFQALDPGQLFLFKLHRPDDYIVGGGVFSHWTRLPVSIAWDTFGPKNGASDLHEMRSRIERYRKIRPAPHEDYEVGCILLQQPFFFSRDEWMAVPDWHPNIVRGKGYDLAAEPGRTLWRDVELRLRATRRVVVEEEERYGEPVLVRPRLGQASFRVLVTDAYNRCCAITGGRALPVLVAAHIRPFAESGEHRIDNGLLLRSDLHTLFDRGYVTVTPDFRMEVSRRIRADWHNGDHYYRLHGQTVRVPQRPNFKPAGAFLRWHNETAFLR